MQLHEDTPKQYIVYLPMSYAASVCFKASHPMYDRIWSAGMRPSAATNNRLSHWRLSTPWTTLSALLNVYRNSAKTADPAMSSRRPNRHSLHARINAVLRIHHAHQNGYCTCQRRRNTVESAPR